MEDAGEETVVDEVDNWDSLGRIDWLSSDDLAKNRFDSNERWNFPRSHHRDRGRRA